MSFAVKNLVSALALILAPIMTACASKEHTPNAATPKDAGSPARCVRDGECGAGHRCYFSIAAGCAAKGQCLPVPEPSCLTERNYCGCDGTTVLAGCLEPDGYAPAPVSRPKPCNDHDGAP